MAFTNRLSLRFEVVLGSATSVTAMLAAMGAYPYASQRQAPETNLLASVDAAAVRLAAGLPESVWKMAKDPP